MKRTLLSFDLTFRYIPQSSADILLPGRGNEKGGGEGQMFRRGFPKPVCLPPLRKPFCTTEIKLMKKISAVILG